MASYMLLAAPVEHADAFNRMVNVRNGDSGDALKIRLSTTGQEPATYLCGGWPPADDEELVFYQSPAEHEFVPPEGWPILDGVTEQEVLDARAASEISVRSGPNSAVLPVAAMGALFADLGIQEIFGDP